MWKRAGRATKLPMRFRCAAIAFETRFGDETPARSLLGSRAERLAPRSPGAPTALPRTACCAEGAIFIGIARRDVPGHKTDHEGKELKATCLEL